MNILKKLLLSILATVLTLSFAAPSKAAVTFSDIGDSQMKLQIEALAEAGIVSGPGDGTFRPKASVTRAEFAKMLASAMGTSLDANAASQFTDVPTWAAPYVGALVNENVTNGKSSTKFGASENISRQEMAVMFVRAMGLEELVMITELQPNFQDMNMVATWAQPHVAFAKEIGFIVGDGVSYFPENSSLREQVAKLTYQWLYESNLYFENSIEVISQTFFYDVSSVTLVDQFTVDVTFTDGTVERYAIDFLLNYILENTYYEALASLTGHEWVQLPITEKQELVSYVINFWASDYSQFNVLMAAPDANTLLITELDNFYVNSANMDYDIITQLEEKGLQNSVIEYYVPTASSKDRLPVLK
jgi:hypothetical protein